MTPLREVSMREDTRRLELLGHFRLIHGGRPVRVPAGGQRLLAFLAVAAGPQRREHVAWTLWSDHSDARALASLRTALWRLPRPGGRPLFTDTDNDLELAPDVDVDWWRRAREAREVAGGKRRASADLVDALRVGPAAELVRGVARSGTGALPAVAIARAGGVVGPSAGRAGWRSTRCAVASPPSPASRSGRVPTAASSPPTSPPATPPKRTRQCDSYLQLLTAAGLRPRASDALWGLFSEPLARSA